MCIAFAEVCDVLLFLISQKSINSFTLRKEWLLLTVESVYFFRWGLCSIRNFDFSHTALKTTYFMKFTEVQPQIYK